MPDFAKVMAAAVLILAGLLVLTTHEFSFVTPYPEGKVYYTTYEKLVGEEEIEEEKYEVKRETIGINEEVKHIIVGRNILVSFTAGKQTILSEENFTVKNGFGGRQFYEKTFEIEWPESVEKGEIELEIKRTNLYAPLIIMVNDVKLYENYTKPGKIKINVNASLLKEKNVIFIAPASSGWRLWAPAAYELAMNFSVYTFALKKRKLSFNIGDELESLTLLRLYWRVNKIEGDGNLIVKVNGVEVYRGRDKVSIIDINTKDVKLKKEENTIELLVERDTAFLIEKFEVLLFYEIRKEPIFWYNISYSEYEHIAERNATLKFYIERMKGDVVSLSIQIKDGAGYEHVIIPQGVLREEREYEVLLTKNELAPGNNRIEFKVGGDGYIVIRNVSISVGSE